MPLNSKRDIKASIQGSRYHTLALNTVLIGDAASQADQDADLYHWWSAGLYRTGRGGYFLAGEGGALTKYGRRDTEGRLTQGQRIIPLTHEDAQQWAIQHLGHETVRKHFKGKHAHTDKT